MRIQKSFSENGQAKGVLYLVGTPIGNLEDMTFRAIRTLKEADCIAAEDTRQTRKLLNYYDISGKVVSYHEHNKETSGRELIRLLLNGNTVALVSDAGLPAISDPGYDLVLQCVEEGITVVPIPGANAALSALIVSGLPTAQFTFVGFLPRDKKGLRQELERLSERQETLLLYESPHRIEKTLSAIAEVWGGRNIALAREITKKYEEVVRGTVQECLQYIETHPPQGEYCIVVQGSQPSEEKQEDVWWSELSITDHVQHYVLKLEGLSVKEAIRQVAVDRSRPRREIYNQFENEKKS